MGFFPCDAFDDMSNTTEKVIGLFGGKKLYGRYIEQEVTQDPVSSGDRGIFTIDLGNVTLIDVIGTFKPLNGSPWANVNIQIGCVGADSTMDYLTCGYIVNDDILRILIPINYTRIYVRCYVMYIKD